jgi:hypothetical protein
MRTPNIVLTMAASMAAPKESWRAAETRGSKAMAQNSFQPREADEIASPASGSRTMSER